jgi:hypothetical protein
MSRALARSLLVGLASVPCLATIAAIGAQSMLHEHPGIQYAVRPSTDRIARLSQTLTAGELRLPRDSMTGYLRPLLDRLGISTESQLLVFSKTGVQREYISPRNPRALFFDESVVVAYVPGAPTLEIASHDPQQGVIFYTLDQTAATPALTRRTTCLACHVSESTLGVPGMIVRSNTVGDDGNVLGQRSPRVTDETLHSDRWGGWYVTSGGAPPPYTQTDHSGNVTFSPGGASSNRLFVDWFNSSPEKHGYVSALSEMAALFVFEHQMHAINLLTRLNWEARIAADGKRSPEAELTVRTLIDQLADYLLFVREAHFAVPIYPRPAFSGQLEARFPKDSRGRSLARLDLVTRLLRYPCSYMVYSAAFEALPTSVKHLLYARMRAIVAGQVKSSPYDHPDTDRKAVLDILTETKPDF